MKGARFHFCGAISVWQSSAGPQEHKPLIYLEWPNRTRTFVVITLLLSNKQRGAQVGSADTTGGDLHFRDSHWANEPLWTDLNESNSEEALKKRGGNSWKMKCNSREGFYYEGGGMDRKVSNFCVTLRRTCKVIYWDYDILNDCVSDQSTLINYVVFVHRRLDVHNNSSSCRDAVQRCSTGQHSVSFYFLVSFI